MTSKASPISVGYSASGIADESSSAELRGVALAAASSADDRAPRASPPPAPALATVFFIISFSIERR